LEEVILQSGQKLKIIKKLPDFFEQQDYFLVRDLDTNQEIVVSQSNLAENIVKKKYTDEEKINLYRRYFRGREDVVAKYWENAAKKRKGYAPVCRIKWAANLGCRLKYGTRCASCAARQFVPYSKQIIERHIKSGADEFYGFYPMLKDDTTYLLVMDFDQENATSEVCQILETCSLFEIDVLSERSRSGMGIHLWFFFKEKIPVSLAREFGKNILNYTIMNSDKINFSSFDRMIPHQDTLPVGDFGSLIALPLKWTNIQQGRSVFLDENFNPVLNLWEHLAKCRQYSQNQIINFSEKIAQSCPHEGYDHSEISTLKKVLYPASIICKKSSELIISKKNLTRREMVSLMYLATFANPEYHRLVKMRAPVWDTPQLITCAREDRKNIYLPRALEKKLQEVVPKINWQNCVSSGVKIAVKFKGKLYAEQEEAIQSLAAQEMGILAASPGFGKTVVGAKLISERKCSTLILVHLDNLVNQWFERLNQFLEIDSEPFVEYTKTGRVKRKEKVGIISGAKLKQTKVIDIASIGKLSKMENLADFFNDYGMVIVDECHHIAARTFEKVIKHANSQFIYGLSATPERKDGLEPIIFMRCGEIAFQSKIIQPDNILIEQNLYPRYTSIGSIEPDFQDLTYTKQIAYLAKSMTRNEQIVEDIVRQARSGRFSLVLSERVEHLKLLKQLVIQKLPNFPIFELTGQNRRADNQATIKEIKQKIEPFIIFSTSKYAGEGFDLPQLETLFLTLPFSWKGNQQQYLGRLQRGLKEKDELRVYDYVDISAARFARMFQKRLVTYKKLNYKLTEDELSAVYQSQLFTTENFAPTLEKDLNQVQQNIFLVISKLNSILVKKLVQLKSCGVALSIFTKNAEILRGKSAIFQRNYLAMLKNAGVLVDFRPKIEQSILVIDGTICWYGNLQFYGFKVEDATSLRLVSKKLADSLLNKRRKN